MTLHTRPWWPTVLPSNKDQDFCLNNSGRLIDGSSNLWTVYGGVVYKNNAKIGFTSAIDKLVYHNSQFYARYNLGGTVSWWRFDGTNWVASTDPATSSSAIVPFWGVNGHLTWQNSSGYYQSNWGNNYNAMIDLGMKSYRNGYGGRYSTSNGSITGSDAGFFNSFHNLYPDIVLTPVLLPQYQTSWTNVAGSATESTAYTMGFNLGVDAATNIPWVPYFEVGNEFDGSQWSDGGIVSNSGANKTDFNNAKYLICRGSVRGMIAGIKSVLPNAKIASPGGTWVHTGFHDMLRDGSTPNAPTTYDSSKIVDWDITSWHCYTNNNSNDNFEALVGQPYTNLFTHLATWQKPIVISEYGVNLVRDNYPTQGQYTDVYPNRTTAIVAALTTQGYLMDKWYAIQTKYPGAQIIGCQLYQLSDAAGNTASPDRNGNEMHFGIIKEDSTTQSYWYSAVRSYIANHPV